MNEQITTIIKTKSKREFSSCNLYLSDGFVSLRFCGSYSFKIAKKSKNKFSEISFFGDSYKSMVHLFPEKNLRPH